MNLKQLIKLLTDWFQVPVGLKMLSCKEFQPKRQTYLKVGKSIICK